MDSATLVENDLMAPWVANLVSKLSAHPYWAELLLCFLAGVVGIILAFFLRKILEHILRKRLQRYSPRTQESSHRFSRLTFYGVSTIPMLTISQAMGFYGYHEWLVKLVAKAMGITFVFVVALMLTNAIKLFGLLYKQKSSDVQRPIDGILSVIIAFVWAVAVIIIVSTLINKSPLYLLSGLGAMAAVLMLVFQQTILSFVASVEVNTNHLVNVGDWIVMDSRNIDGIVEAITLHTFKVRNWDMALVTVPVCDLANDSFINYTAMQKAGGRRIKRAILIDQRTIRFLTVEEIEVLKGFDLLKEYLADKESELSAYNASRSAFNARYLTNLGTFRAYVQNYLEHHPAVRQDMTIVARELAPATSGVPLEIYCFCQETSMPKFERIQADILEHLLAVLPSFRLRVFQDCSDIYQEIGNVPDVIGSAFRFDQYQNPVYPGNRSKA